MTSFFTNTRVKVYNKEDLNIRNGSEVTINKRSPSEKKKATIILFYAPWCHWCNVIKPEWIKLADTINASEVDVAAVDCDKNPSIASDLNIEGFPTITLVRGGKVITYNGERTALSIKKFIKKELDNANNGVIHFNGDSDIQPQMQNVGNSTPGKASKNWFNNTNVKIQMLRDTHFNTERRTLNLEKPVLVLYFAPWCYWCKQLKPEWIKVSAELPSLGVNIAAMDCTQYPVIADVMGIDGYPTIVLYTSSSPSGIPYMGPRTSKEIINWTQTQVASVDNLNVRNQKSQDKEVPLFAMIYSPGNASSAKIKGEILSKIAVKYNNFIEVGAINIEKSKHVADRLMVSYVPSFFLFKDSVGYEYTGDINVNEISKFISKHIKT